MRYNLHSGHLRTAPAPHRHPCPAPNVCICSDQEPLFFLLASTTTRQSDRALDIRFRSRKPVRHRFPSPGGYSDRIPSRPNSEYFHTWAISGAQFYIQPHPSTAKQSCPFPCNAPAWEALSKMPVRATDDLHIFICQQFSQLRCNAPSVL